MHLILFHYNSGEWLGLPFIFSVQKNLQLPVQVLVGFLTRPVTGYEAQHHAGHDEYTDDYDSSLHHANVPCMLPKTRAIMIAEMNTPASMYTKSI